MVQVGISVQWLIQLLQKIKAGEEGNPELHVSSNMLAAAFTAKKGQAEESVCSVTQARFLTQLLQTTIIRALETKPT